MRFRHSTNRKPTGPQRGRRYTHRTVQLGRGGGNCEAISSASTGDVHHGDVNERPPASLLFLTLTAGVMLWLEQAHVFNISSGCSDAAGRPALQQPRSSARAAMAAWLNLSAVRRRIRSWGTRELRQHCRQKLPCSSAFRCADPPRRKGPAADRRQWLLASANLAGRNRETRDEAGIS